MPVNELGSYYTQSCASLLAMVRPCLPGLYQEYTWLHIVISRVKYWEC